MNRRLILMVVLLALGATAFWLWKRDTGTTLAGPMADFVVQDTASVDRIFIAESSGRSVDLKKTGTGWTVNGLPANEAPIHLLLKTFRRVVVRSPVAKSMQAGVIRVMSSSAKRVEIYQGDDVPTKTWFVGHATQDHYGTFMLLEIPGKGRSDVPFILGMEGFTGFLSTRFHADLDQWRSTVLFRYPDLLQVKEYRVQSHGTGQSGFTIRNEEGRLSVLDSAGHAVPFDTTFAQDVMLQLRNLHFEYFERVIPKAVRDSVMATPPRYVVEVKSTAGEQRIPLWGKPAYTGQKSLEFVPLQGEDTGRLYALLDDTALVVAQSHVVNRILPGLEELRK
jgi:hypothetical protein